MDKQKLLLLIERYLSNQASDSERQELDRWYDQFENHPGIDPGLLVPPATLEQNRFCRAENRE